MISMSRDLQCKKTVPLHNNPRGAELSCWASTFRLESRAGEVRIERKRPSRDAASPDSYFTYARVKACAGWIGGTTYRLEPQLRRRVGAVLFLLTRSKPELDLSQRLHQERAGRLAADSHTRKIGSQAKSTFALGSVTCGFESRSPSPGPMEWGSSSTCDSTLSCVSHVNYDTA